MRRLIFTPAANENLVEISGYIELTSGSIDVAEAFIGKLVAYCRRLAANPVILGRPRAILIPDLRSVPFGNYLIFIRYLPTTAAADTLEIVRLVNGRRDVEALFAAES